MKASRFVKKPIVIEAIQLTWGNWNAVCDFVPHPHFKRGCYLDEAGQPKPPEAGEGKLGLLINTPEGTIVASENDWIIKGVKGEYYPCKPDIFEATYQPVD